MDALPLLLSLLFLLFLPHCHPAKVVERGIPAVLFPDKDAIRVPTSSVFPLTGSRSFTEPTYPVNRHTILQRLLNVGFKRKEALAAMEEELHDLDHSFDYLAAIHNEPTNEVLPCIGSERCFRKTNDELYEESVKSAAFLQLKMQVRARRFRRQLQQRRKSLLEEAVPLDCARFRSLNEDETVSQAPALLEVTSGRRRRRHRKKFLGKIGKGIRKLANKVGSFVGKLFRKKPPAAAPPAKKAEAPPAAADPPVTPPLKETPGAPFESSSSMTLNNLRLNKVKYNRNEIISPVNVNVTETPHDAHNPEAAEASEEEPTVTSPTTGESSESTESSESSGANETASEPPRPAHLLKTQEPFVATLRSRIACAQQSTHVPGPPAWLRKSLRRAAKELEAEPKPPAGQRNSLAWPAIVPIRTKVINGIRRPNFETPPEAQAIPLDQVRPPTEQPSSLAMTPPPPPDPVQPGQVNVNANTGTVPDATADGTAQETP